MSGRECPLGSSEARKLMEAVLGILPSSSRLTQLLLLLPMGEDEARDVFPEFLEDVELWESLRVTLGIDVGADGVLRLRENSLGYAIRRFIEDIFELLRDPLLRTALYALVGFSFENPEFAWVRIRAERVLSDTTLGRYARVILLYLLSNEKARIDELLEATRIDREAVENTIYLLQRYKLVKVEGEVVRLEEDVKHHARLLAPLLREKRRHTAGGSP